MSVIQTLKLRCFIKLLTFNVIYFFIFVFLYVGVLFSYSSLLEQQLSSLPTNSIQEKCEIVHCSKIYNPSEDVIFLKDNKNELNKFIDQKFYQIKYFSSLGINNFNFYVMDGKYNYQIDLSFLNTKILNFYLLSALTLTLLLGYFLYVNTLIERENNIKTLAGKEALLANKSMIMITENIHHELNTPMEVIDNKIFNIKETIFDLLGRLSDNHNCTEDIKGIRKTLEKDFEYVSQSNEIIYNILGRMKGFKQLRYSNGDKNLYELLEGAFNVTSISNNNFVFNISEKMKLYSIKSDLFKNADLINIIINHTKNSLEANATKVMITFNKFQNGFLYFRMIDNGNGIKEEMVDGIFLPNFSTKTKTNSGIRGNGLYLNKSIIESGHGSLTLIETSNYGTTFELKVPAIERTPPIVNPVTIVV